MEQRARHPGLSGRRAPIHCGRIGGARRSNWLASVLLAILVVFPTALRLACVLLAAMALHGCAALALPAFGSVVSGSAGALVRAGAASIKGGTVYRTFDASLRDVHAATQTMLSRLEFPTPETQVTQEGVTLRTVAIERQVRIDLQPITAALTQVRITAVIGPWQKDPATATTLVDLLAEALGPELRALPPR